MNSAALVPNIYDKKILLEYENNYQQLQLPLNLMNKDD